MTRLFTSGFEAGVVDFTVPGNGVVTGSAANRGHGIYSMRFGTTTNPEQAIPAGVTELFVRFVLYAASGTANRRFQFEDGSGNVLAGIDWGWSGSDVVDIYVGTTLVASSTLFFPAGVSVVQIHYLMDNTVGQLEVKVNETSFVSFSGDTNPGTATEIAKVAWVRNGVSFDMDDVAINDSSGSVDNSWPNDGWVLALTPTGNGTYSNFVGSDLDSVNNYQLVDERPPSMSDYIQSGTVGDKDTYPMSSITLNPGEAISRLFAQAWGLSANATIPQNCKLGIISGGTEYWDAASQSLPTVNPGVIKSDEQLVDPFTAAAWTEAGVNSIEAGIQVTT